MESTFTLAGTAGTRGIHRLLITTTVLCVGFALGRVVCVRASSTDFAMIGLMGVAAFSCAIGVLLFYVSALLHKSEA